MPGIQPVCDPAQIDLTRHGLLEASAGTGKTYTIEHLVIRILVEEPAIGLDNILLVTFTEKATCELKTRLYERIGQAARRATGEERARLCDALDRFDAAAIDTIHGFCNGLLQDFAFENQSLFQTERLHDAEVWDAALVEVMRRVWPQTFGTDLEALLGVSGFSRRRSRFLRAVTAVARTFRSQAGDTLLPDGGNQGLLPIKADLEAVLNRLGRMVDAVLVRGFERLNINAGTKKAILAKVIGPLAAFLSARAPGQPLDLFALARLVETMRTYGAFKDRGAACLVPAKWLAKGANPEVCPDLYPLAEDVGRLVAACDTLSHLLAIETIRRLPDQVRRLKEDQGAIGFDDMLTRVWEALQGPGGNLLRGHLRARYAIAFVDEFQDTDPIQWCILEDVFLKAPDGTNRLFLIGDPKQAIYAFRGADVYAYLEAKKAMAGLAMAGRAGLYRLETNWRSMAELVDAFNRLFSQPDWFGADGGVFGYTPSRSAVGPSAGDPQTGMRIVDLTDTPNPVMARQVMARWCADTICRLVGGGDLTVNEAAGPRPIDFGDIAVLVRTRSEMPALERAFKARQIPYSTYKKPGLFTCAQAHHLSWVLNAAAAPGNVPLVKKALLTPFFDADPEKVYRLDTLAPSSDAGRLMAFWVELGRQRRWSQLFQSIEMDTGFVFRQSIRPGWDRVRANHRQIVDYLLTEARRRSLDIKGLTALLDANRRRGAAEDADLHQIDAEGRKVQLMTIHVSKGLEFAVVFVAGGLTHKPHDAFHRFHRPDARGRLARVIDISAKADPPAHFAEQTAEDKRLFYVALTRASRLVYVPYCPVADATPSSGPMTGFGALALEEAFDPAIPQNSRFWETPGDPAERLCPAAPAAALPPPPSDGSFLPAAIGDFRSRKIWLTSFSGLRAQQSQVFALTDTRGRPDDEPLKTNVAGHAAGGAPPVLPGGAALGTALHLILETIDYDRVMAAAPDLMAVPDLATLIATELAAGRLAPELAPAVAALVADTLTASITIDGDRFVLGQLPRADRLHEAGFCFPCPAGQDRQLVRGAIDLIFRRQGRYFIADWKSNYLEQGYGPSSLDACMTAADYRLQYLIYAVAGRRFLKARLPGFDVKRHFGGIFYFFLRGMGRGEGVYYVPPERLGSGAALERQLEQRLRLESQPAGAGTNRSPRSDV